MARKVAPVDVLTVANAVICTYGWLSKKEATGDKIPTAEIVTNILYPRRGILDDRDTKEYVEMCRAGKERTDQQVAKSVIEWVNSDENIDSASDYMWNLYRTIGNGTEPVAKHKIPIIVSAINSFKNYLKTKIENEVLYSGNHVGKLKQRLTLDVKVHETIRRPGYDRPILILKFMDEEKNLFVWFCSSEDVHASFEYGKMYRIKGTVKKHDEFAGTKQTILTRVAKVDD